MCAEKALLRKLMTYPMNVRSLGCMETEGEQLGSSLFGGKLTAKYVSGLFYALLLKYNFINTEHLFL